MAMETLIAELSRKLDEEKETLDRRYRDYGAAVYHDFGELDKTEAKNAIEEQLKAAQSIENALTEVRRISLAGIEI